jgi:hypothetical protein
MGVENRQFWATVYKSDNEFYQAGKAMQINCRHENMGVMGMNTYGEIVPVPGTLNAPVSSPPTQSVLVPQGTVFQSTSAFGDANFKVVTMIKDMVNLCVYYVDTESYDANVIKCNTSF